MSPIILTSLQRESLPHAVEPLANNVKLIGIEYTVHLPSSVKLFISESDHIHLSRVVNNFLSANQSTLFRKWCITFYQSVTEQQIVNKGIW